MATSKKPLYEVIFRQYKNRILSGELTPGTRLPTEMELLKEFNVSRITVSRALKELELNKFVKRIKGSGSYVTENEWQDSVKKIDSSADRISLDFISLILPFAEDFSSLFLKGIEDVARTEGYFVTFHNSEEDSEMEIELIEEALSRGSQGIIVYPSSETANLHMYSNMLIRKYPFVLIDRKIPGIETSLVTVDNSRGTEEVTTHLIRMGHKNIIFVGTWINRISSEQERYRGFCQAHINEGIPLLKKNLYSFNDMESIPPDYGNITDNEKRPVHYLFDLLEGIEEAERPTAIVAVSDQIARMIMVTAFERGISIPDDYSLSGFDNLPYAAHLQVPLTTVEQPAYDIGSKAADLLFRHMKSPESPMELITIPPELITRESTAKH